MLTIGELFLLVIGWSCVGLWIFGISSRPGEAFSAWRFNPIEVYNNYKVNYFGAFTLTLAFNLLCPVVSVGYWFYKLCTIGRK